MLPFHCQIVSALLLLVLGRVRQALGVLLLVSSVLDMRVVLLSAMLPRSFPVCRSSGRISVALILINELLVVERYKNDSEEHQDNVRR